MVKKFGCGYGRATHYNNNFSRSIFEDKSGVLWLATLSNGLYKANSSASNFEPQGYGMNALNSLSGQHILCVSEDNSGNLGLGTAEEGLYKYNFESKKLKQYSYKTGNVRGLGSGETINAIEKVDDEMFIVMEYIEAGNQEIFDWRC